MNFKKQLQASKLLQLLPVLAITTLLFMPSHAAMAQMSIPQPLKVGDKAPVLDVSDWITDGEGKYPHVTEFESGKFYVVEFWATWCGPCIMMMPEIAKMQEKYDGKIQFLSITDENIDEVMMFKESTDQNQTPFKEYMNKYSVGVDPDGSTHVDFFGNASTGIPASFVIGDTGEVELIDHPAAIGPVLDQIAAGTWDREKYYARIKAREAVEVEVSEALENEDYAAALQASEKLVEFYEEDEQLQLRFKRTLLALNVKGEQGQSFFKETLDQFAKEDGAVAAMVWKLVEMKNERMAVDEENLKIAEEALRNEIEEMPLATDEDKMMKGATIDILAHLLFVSRRLDDAIETQEQAAELLDEKEITDFLTFLKDKKAAVEATDPSGS